LLQMVAKQSAKAQDIANISHIALFNKT